LAGAGRTSYGALARGLGAGPEAVPERGFLVLKPLDGHPTSLKHRALEVGLPLVSHIKFGIKGGDAIVDLGD
jgi:hypothetical protein